jgi:hypothetical protein
MTNIHRHAPQFNTDATEAYPTVHNEGHLALPFHRNVTHTDASHFRYIDNRWYRIRTFDMMRFRVSIYLKVLNKSNKQTPWPLVRERTIPTDRPPLVDEI